MSSASSPLSLLLALPVEVNQNVLSFLDAKELCIVACVSPAFNGLAQDFQVWKPQSEQAFGKLIANGAKEPKKSWKTTYEELEASRKARTEQASKVLQAHVKKTQTDDIHYRTQMAAAALFGFAPPAPGTHYVPTKAVVGFGGRRIMLYQPNGH